jgi:manganese efflux pump family protein
MLALLLIALSVGLDNFGAATAIGVGGVSPGMRFRVALVFGLFEGAMPVVGLVIGHSVASTFGGAAPVIGGVLLGLTGAYTILREGFAKRKDVPERRQVGALRLLALGAALSVDNVVVGFALGAYHVNLVAALVTIALVSVGLSLLGLELGSRLGQRVGERSELVGGAMLILVGVAIGTGLL